MVDTVDPTPDAKKAVKPAPQGDSLAESIKTVVMALAIALVLRIFLFQPFNIPSESMRPGLVVGDYLWTSKWDYGFSNASIPFSPKLIEGRVFGHAPERGDVVVFKLPSDPRQDYIKRLIGLPGDRIQVVGGQLVINDTPVKQEALSPETITEQGGNVRVVQRYRETLPNGRSYVTYDRGPGEMFDDTQVFVVPEGHYFMMGDNRDNSTDSRADPILQAGVGFVPAENLVGRGRIVLLSFDETTRIYLPWTWFTGLRLDRLAVPIR
ncbi:signal peptidase I [Candidatus Phycosocius bacilliformis]|uniref:Signal peptidase I n=1 Tax=Candidatus Phycosocius bacilliformis TaxID=1445552 RepID=A0A2P2E851_9PROT|nr:signal peptidase I [Candidatus Phycosocius bacilliformis]GBF57248.1 signal peptidase I [Candidatus Phycosocius bacilliformis]